MAFLESRGKSKKKLWAEYFLATVIAVPLASGILWIAFQIGASMLSDAESEGTSTGCSWFQGCPEPDTSKEDEKIQQLEDQGDAQHEQELRDEENALHEEAETRLREEGY